MDRRVDDADGIGKTTYGPSAGKQNAQNQSGGEPFVLLFDPITVGTPAGKKEIDVLVNNQRKKKREFFEFPFFWLVIPRRKNVLFWKVYAWSLEKMQS